MTWLPAVRRFDTAAGPMVDIVGGESVDDEYGVFLGSDVASPIVARSRWIRQASGCTTRPCRFIFR